MKIVVLDADTLGEDLNLSPLHKEGDVTVYRTTKSDEVKARVTGADVVILNKVKIREEQLPKIGTPRLICIAATGYDNIDIDACRRRGIAVANVKGYSTDSVAQITVGLVLSLVSHLPAYCSSVADGTYTHGGNANRLVPPYHEINDMTWGILGAGRIGSRVADVAQALGCRVLTCRRYADTTSVSMETLLAHADIITIHTPLTAETRGMIGAEQIAAMKDGVILVNMARGAVTDESAIANAVLSGKIGGFGADVFSVEPFGEDHPFYALRNHPHVLLTPHMSWGAIEARKRCLNEMILNIRAFFGGRIRNRVDM